MIESQEYDYLISVTAPMNLIAAIANSLSKKNIKLYGTIHSMISLENRKFKKLRYRLLKIFDKYIEKTIVVSNEAEEDYIKTIGISKKKTVTIYNPVISEEVFKLQTEKCDHKWLNKNRDYKVIISAGRLNEAKDFPTLLKSIAIARKKQDIRLIILGEGELRNELEKLIQQLNIRESVELLGFDNNPYKYFYNSDLFVLSSKREGLPTVLIEALACGIRVVSTNCKSGPYEILKGGEYGRLVTVGDEVELANNILDALDSEVNKELYITRALDFSIDNAVDNYLNLIT